MDGRDGRDERLGETSDRLLAAEDRLVVGGLIVEERSLMTAMKLQLLP